MTARQKVVFVLAVLWFPLWYLWRGLKAAGQTFLEGYHEGVRLHMERKRAQQWKEWKAARIKARQEAAEKHSRFQEKVHRAVDEVAKTVSQDTEANQAHAEMMAALEKYGLKDKARNLN